MRDGGGWKAGMCGRVQVMGVNEQGLEGSERGRRSAKFKSWFLTELTCGAHVRRQLLLVKSAAGSSSRAALA